MFSAVVGAAVAIIGAALLTATMIDMFPRYEPVVTTLPPDAMGHYTTIKLALPPEPDMVLRRPLKKII